MYGNYLDDAAKIVAEKRDIPSYASAHAFTAALTPTAPSRSRR